MIKVNRVDKSNVCFNCKKVGDKIFEIDFNKKFFSNLKLCVNCAKLLQLELAKEFIPKGIKNNSCEYKIIEK